MGEGRGRWWPKLGALTLPCPCQAIMTYLFSISEVSVGVLRARLRWAVQRAGVPGCTAMLRASPRVPGCTAVLRASPTSSLPLRKT